MMNLLRIVAITACTLPLVSNVAAQEYKSLMSDMSVNFYDVCKSADAYFETHPTGKGSGYKAYQRWKAENESKYYPSGDRTVDPLFAWNAYIEFLSQNSDRNTWFDNGWRDLGPYHANNITEGYNPGIGRVETFYVDPNNTSKLYLGSRSGGFWKTSNGGVTWINTTDFLPASGVHSIAVSYTNPDSVLIVIQNATNYSPHGIYRSVNGGDTWTLTNFNPSNLSWGGLGGAGRIYKIVYHPTIPNLIFVGTSQGLYRSDDNLNTWTQYSWNSDVTDIEFHPTDPSIMYMYDDYYWGSNGDVILRSTDTGQTFTQSGALPGNNGETCFISTSPQSPSNVYAASSNGVYKSIDEGQTFTFLSNPDESCRGFIVSDLDTLNMIYGYLNLEASTDGGNNFNEITDWSNTSPDPTYVHADLRAAECLNGVFYVGTDGYLAKSSDNGQTWTRLNDGTGIREFYAVGVSQSNWSVSMAGSQDNGTSTLVDFTWWEWNGGDGMEAIVHPLNENWMMGSWQYGTRQRTKDGGATRHGVNTPQAGSGNADWEAPLAYDPLQHMTVYHFAEDIYASKTFGQNWNLIGSPNIGIIREAAIAENNSNIIAIARNSNLQLSTDGGVNFYSIFSGLPTHSITDIAFDPKNDSTIVVTYNRYQNDGQKIYISHDLGENWQNITYNLGNMPLRCAVIDFSDSSYIYVGAEIGVYYKSMNGTSWTLYNPNLPNVTVKDLEIQWGTNSLRGATYGRGLWDYTLVDRIDYPSIVTTTITDPPTESDPYENIDQYVTSKISYNGTLTSVFVRWTANNLLLDNTITMNNTIDSTWVSSTPIPNFPDNTDLYFKVYAVGSNGDTSETYRYMYNIKGTSDIATNYISNLAVYPNPTDGLINLDLGDLYSKAEVVINDLTGRVVYRKSFLNLQKTKIELDLVSGQYLLTVRSGEDQSSVKLTIE